MLCGLITGAVVWMLVGQGVFGGAVGALAGLAAWWLESQLHPFTNCWWCHGRPRTSWSWCTTAWRECWACGGRGKRRRVLARRS